MCSGQTPPAADPGPAPVRTAITVSEKIEAEAPAAISVLPRLRLRETPGVNLDDRLRDVPGFSLFRRSSSLTAHPTTQGVSLRGIGSSGASRSLVLWDGIPVNDPFGGWVYWTRFAPDAVERVEISRGASTSVYGDRAMGGAIALFSRSPERHRLSAGYEAGNREQHDAWAGYSHLFSRFGLSGHGRAYTTDGFYIIPERLRGPVDTRAGVRFVTGDVKLDWFGGAQRGFFKSDILVEDRKNGTVLQNNSTALGTVAAGYEREAGSNVVSVNGFHTREEFRSVFSAIAANRRTETLTFRQSVPVDAVGGSGLWRRRGSGWNVIGGADVFRVEGYSIDSLAPSGKRIGGGSLLQHGVFAQTDVAVGPARLFLGGRHHFTGQDRRFFSPSAGLTAGRGMLRGRASVYRSFRAPTLNEFFREFRAGNAVTQANPLLKPETLFGAEAGVDVVGETRTLRLTLFRNQIDDIITNVTLSTSPTLIVRQRQNAASALSRGVEASANGRWSRFRGELSYLYVESRFATRERVPQIPKHQGSAQLSFDHKGTLASIGLRSFARQFEDDRNLFLLPGFATVQVVLRQRLAKGLSATAQFENLLNREFLTAFSPVPTVGSPRLWRAGLRWEGRIR